MQGIVRDKQHQPRQLHPLTRDELRRLINAIAKHSPTPRAERDTAIILVGYAGLLRRSEITGLRFEDVRVTGEEISLLLRESKTDQEGKGELIPLPHLPAADADICPTRALQTWLGVLRQHGLTAGKIFRGIRRGLTENISNDGLSDQSVNLIVKRWAKVIGIAPETIGAHSALRAGMATQMSRKGVSMDVIKKSGRWKSDAVAFGYIRRTQKEQQEAKTSALSD